MLTIERSSEILKDFKIPTLIVILIDNNLIKRVSKYNKFLEYGNTSRRYASL